MGKMLLLIGALCMIAGAVWMILENAGLGKFLGHLPGDLNFTRGNVSFHFPLVTCLIISVVLSLILNIFFRH